MNRAAVKFFCGLWIPISYLTKSLGFRLSFSLDSTLERHRLEEEEKKISLRLEPGSLNKEKKTKKGRILFIRSVDSYLDGPCEKGSSPTELP